MENYIEVVYDIDTKKMCSESMYKSEGSNNFVFTVKKTALNAVINTFNKDYENKSFHDVICMIIENCKDV